MVDLLQRAENEIRTRRLLSRGQKVLVAVSGGVDSMVLLHILHALAQKNRWQIHVAHFNHRLRKHASDADQRLVRQTAARFRLPFITGSTDVKSFAKKSKLSIEMAARKLRHEFLARAATERKTYIVTLAHHADDQVELFLLRLFRGTGGEGLAGMKWRSPSPTDKRISLVRPLLDFSKAELYAFARENKIQFRQDATNFSTDILRNRIRNELLPLLRKEYQPALDKTILRLMEIVGAESEFVARSSEREFAQIRNQSRLMSAATTNSFEHLPLAIQRRVLQSQLLGLGVAVDFELIESLRQSPNQFVSVGPNHSAARDESGDVRLRTEAEPNFNQNELAIKSNEPGEVVFDGVKLHWDCRIGSQRRSPHRNRAECFDADQIGGRIILRHWRPGDRFQPIGLKSETKLQDLFVNAKIPSELRRRLVLAEAASGEIFWVEGLRIGERFKLTPQTARTLVWKWSNLAV